MDTLTIRGIKGDPEKDPFIVQTKMNGITRHIRMDTGVGHTIIGEDDLAAIQAHKPVQVKPSTMNLVPYATTEMEQPIKLPVKGKVDITIENMAGARIDTTAFVVRGEAEALLGARDSLKLGIIQLNRNGAKTAKEPEINIRNVGDTSEKGPLLSLIHI